MRPKLAIYALFALIIFTIVGFASVRIAHGMKSRSLASVTQIFRGPVVRTVYSSLQVEVVLKNNRIIDVIPIVLPNSDERTIALARLAVPILRREAIAENSATIQGVSGASVTSGAYIRSLQGALAVAGR